MKNLFLLLVLILMAQKSFSFDCSYDFDTKKISINTEKSQYKKEYIKNGERIKVFIKNTKSFSELEDYLVRETLDKKYRITYSLVCQDKSI